MDILYWIIGLLFGVPLAICIGGLLLAVIGGFLYFLWHTSFLILTGRWDEIDIGD